MGRDCEEEVARVEKEVVSGKAWRLWRRMKWRGRRVLCWGWLVLTLELWMNVLDLFVVRDGKLGTHVYPHQILLRPKSSVLSSSVASNTLCLASSNSAPCPDNKSAGTSGSKLGVGRFWAERWESMREVLEEMMFARARMRELDILRGEGGNGRWDGLVNELVNGWLEG